MFEYFNNKNNKKLSTTTSLLSEAFNPVANENNNINNNKNVNKNNNINVAIATNKMNKNPLDRSNAVRQHSVEDI